MFLIRPIGSSGVSAAWCLTTIYGDPVRLNRDIEPLMRYAIVGGSGVRHLHHLEFADLAGLPPNLTHMSRALVGGTTPR